MNIDKNNSRDTYLQSTIALTANLRSLFTFLVFEGPRKHVNIYDNTEFQLETIKLILCKSRKTHKNTTENITHPYDTNQDLRTQFDFDILISEMESHKSHIVNIVKNGNYNDSYRYCEKIFIGYLYLLEQMLCTSENEKTNAILQSIIPIIDTIFEDMLSTFNNKDNILPLAA